MIEVFYVIVASVGFVLLDGIVAGWAIPIGARGPEAKAKVIAISWRLSEAALAFAVLWVLWKPILHAGESGDFTNVSGGTMAFWFSVLFTLLFGGVYFVGALFAAVTSLPASQVAYFRNRLEKLPPRI